MKLRALSLLFALTGIICRLTSAAHTAASKLNERAWIACTKENMRTLNVRRVGGRFDR